MGVQALLEDMRGHGESGVVVAVAEGNPRGDVRGRSRMGERCAGFDCVQTIRDRGESVVIDFDEGGCVFRDIARIRHNHRNRLADIAGLVLHQHHRGEQLADGRIGHEEGERLLGRLRQIRSRSNTRWTPGSASAAEASIREIFAWRMRRSARKPHAACRKADVVDEMALAGDERPILVRLTPRPENFGRLYR